MHLLKNRSLKRATWIALAMISFPTGAAFAGHFYVVHPTEWIPCVEAIIFDEGTPSAQVALDAPSAEDYLINEVTDTNPF